MSYQLDEIIAASSHVMYHGAAAGVECRSCGPYGDGVNHWQRREQRVSQSWRRPLVWDESLRPVQRLLPDRVGHPQRRRAAHWVRQRDSDHHGTHRSDHSRATRNLHPKLANMPALRLDLRMAADRDKSLLQPVWLCWLRRWVSHRAPQPVGLHVVVLFSSAAHKMCIFFSPDSSGTARTEASTHGLRAAAARQEPRL